MDADMEDEYNAFSRSGDMARNVGNENLVVFWHFSRRLNEL